jgi:hypothetical protein
MRYKSRYGVSNAFKVLSRHSIGSWWKVDHLASLMFHIAHSFEVTKMSSLLTPESLIPCPTSASFPYTQAPSICLYPFFKAWATAFSTCPLGDCQVPRPIAGIEAPVLSLNDVGRDILTRRDSMMNGKVLTLERWSFRLLLPGSFGPGVQSGLKWIPQF